ncbi:Uncharacterised protein [Bordetella pertussis]|nr:Uncharacterised protein [Bordetella pertussis]
MRNAATSSAMLPRQSTTVPSTSKNKTSISIPRTGSIASLRIAFQDMQDVNPSPAPGEHCRIDDACRVLPEASIWVIAYARRNRAARRPRRQNSIDADSVKVRGPPSTR